MRNFLKYGAVPVLSMVAVCLFPCLFLYARNASEVPVTSMVPFLVVFCVNALLFFLAGALCFRNMSRAAFFADIAMLVVINFCLLAVELRKVIPFLRDRYLLGVLLIGLLAVFLVFLRKKPDMRTGCLLVLIAFGSMCFINLVQAVPAILQSHQVRENIYHDEDVGQDRSPSGLPLPEQVAFGENRPNVYYFLFDEYGGYDNLLHYYDFDNSPFLTALEQRGFSVSWHSRNTEAVNTDTIVPNLMNLDYVVRVENTGHEKAVFRRNARLYRMFLRNGYQINLINHLDYLGAEGCRVLTSNQTRRTISEYLMRNSIYNKFPMFRDWLENFFTFDYGRNYRDSLDNAMEMGLSCWQETGDGPTLTIGYLQCPHSPTMVGRHGEERPFAYGWNWRDHSLYLDQLEFINDYILELVDTLQTHDPEALILLQSDHGNRYAIHMMQLKEWDTYDPYVENPYMQNVLNCAYYRGETFQIEGKTGINTLRLVFRQVLGADLPEITPVEDYSMGYQDEQS